MSHEPSVNEPSLGELTPSPSTLEGARIPIETLEWIIEQIEQRVIDELDRRGLRHNPGVF